jgi:hypothetical protein
MFSSYQNRRLGGDHGLLERRITAPAHKRAGAELQVGEIEKAMSSVTLFYWCTKEDVGKRGHQKQLDLTDEEAESIGV